MVNPDFVRGTKFTIKTIAFLGSHTIVRTIIRNNVIPATAISRITVGGASYIIGDMLGSAAAKYSEQKIDDFVDLLDGKKDAHTVIFS